MSDHIGKTIQGAKSFSIELSAGAATGVILVQYDSGGADGLHERGYRGQYNFVILADAGREWCYSDRHEMAREHPIAESGDPLYNLLQKISSGEATIEDIQDGHHYTEGEVKSM